MHFHKEKKVLWVSILYGCISFGLTADGVCEGYSHQAQLFLLRTFLVWHTGAEFWHERCNHTKAIGFVHTFDIIITTVTECWCESWKFTEVNVYSGYVLLEKRFPNNSRHLNVNQSSFILLFYKPLESLGNVCFFTVLLYF